VFRGRLVGVLRWPQLDRLWQQVLADAGGGWYVYAVGESPPVATASAEQVAAFVSEVDRLLREEHDEAYCGIVYADDLQAPTLVKIYDPSNLGAVCGTSGVTTLPGWTLSKTRPTDLSRALKLSADRQRWWRRLLGG
jgi:hypothetical protein